MHYYTFGPSFSLEGELDRLGIPSVLLSVFVVVVAVVKSNVKRSLFWFMVLEGKVHSGGEKMRTEAETSESTSQQKAEKTGSKVRPHTLKAFP